MKFGTGIYLSWLIINLNSKCKNPIWRTNLKVTQIGRHQLPLLPSTPDVNSIYLDILSEYTYKAVLYIINAWSTRKANILTESVYLLQFREPSSPFVTSTHRRLAHRRTHTSVKLQFRPIPRRLPMLMDPPIQSSFAKGVSRRKLTKVTQFNSSSLWTPHTLPYTLVNDSGLQVVERRCRMKSDGKYRLGISVTPQGKRRNFTEIIPKAKWSL